MARKQARCQGRWGYHVRGTCLCYQEEVLTSKKASGEQCRVDIYCANLTPGPRFRFANVDFAMISGLQRWMDLEQHVSGYDINCQYRLKFKSRIAAIANDAEAYETLNRFDFPPTTAAVGKFHAPAHEQKCRYKFSFNWLPGVGMTDGEAPERIWSTLNAIASRTKEMSGGHRHDVINDFHSDMNARRVHSIGKLRYLCERVVH